MTRQPLVTDVVLRMALACLRASPLTGRECVSYASPSLLSTCTRRQYRLELTAAQHVALLTTLVILPL